MYEKLIERLRTEPLDTRNATLKIYDLCIDASCAIENLQKEVNQLKHKLAHLTPCDACVYDPPSSFGGKPCALCVAQGKNDEE